MAIAPVPCQRTMLRDEVRERLLGRILRREHAPGERLIETHLAREFGTSQSPVREALRQLEVLGVVASEPFRGARVREISRGEVLAIQPVRAALEDVAVREAARRVPDDPIAADLVARAAEAAATAGDPARRGERDVRFHERVVEASGNDVLLELWQTLTFRSVAVLPSDEDDSSRSSAAHASIVAAMLRGDEEAAARAVARDLRALRRRLDHAA
jgi:DNA-binding GntR family transcriptional regulator